MSTSADRTYEEQNDTSLNRLYDKVKNLVRKRGADLAAWMYADDLIKTYREA